MSIDVARLMMPGNVVVVGAKDGSGTSYGVVEAMQRVGFAGTLYAVNRGGTPAHGLPTVTSCTEIGEPVDAAVLLVPAHAVADVLEDVAAAGISTAVVFSSGWGETGADGAARQQDLVARATELGVVLVGPNCLGYLNVARHTGAWIASVAPDLRPGRVAVVSQSGGIGNVLADLAAEYGIGLSCVVTTGNEAMLTTTDVVEYLVADEQTAGIALFAEAIADPERFLVAADSARELGKPIVILKAGSSEIAARNAVSHTGSVVGDDLVVDAALRQAGGVRVRSLEELIVTAQALTHAGPLRAPGIAVVSMSGGSVDVVADQAARLRLDLPQFDDASVADMRALLPEFATVQNPLDLTGGALGDEFERILKIVDRQEDIGAVAVLTNVPPYESCKSPIIDSLLATVGRGLRTISIPGFVLAQSVAHLNRAGRASTDAAGVVALPGLAIGMSVMANLSTWSAGRGRLAPDPPRPRARIDALGDGSPLSEWSARQLLEPLGVPFVPAMLVHSPAEAVSAAARFDARVAIKVVSPDLVHKSDVGAVRLDVRGEDDVRHAYVEVVASAVAGAPGLRVEGVQVAPMRPGGVELLVGVTRDAQWGPALAIGLGGVLVEVLDDVAVRLLPVSDTDVEEMLRELRGARVLDGTRGGRAVDRRALVSAIHRVADAAGQLGDALESLEINPLLVDDQRAEALDAMVVLRTVNR
jgi:acetate---CoA ligase (ADP-forming)